jgi:hypothetical protein
MSRMNLSNTLNLLNPESNGGAFQRVSLSPGFDFVFVVPSEAADASETNADLNADLSPAANVRLFGAEGLDGFTIEESTEGGTVPMLGASNQSPFDVLIIAGQLVRGGKQNRGINTDLFIRAGGSTRIPVTCVEQGRWSGGRGDRFRYGGIEPLEIRAEKFRDVSHSRRVDEGFVANQGKVWRSISELGNTLGARCAGDDLVASLERIQSGQGASADETRHRGAVPHRPGQGAALELDRVERTIVAIQEWMREEEVRLYRAVDTDDQVLQRIVRASIDSKRHELERLNHRREQLRPQVRTPQQRSIAVSQERLAEANEIAKKSSGLLVFFDGEFIAGDIFAKPAWFRTFYANLRDSALVSWKAVAARMSNAAREVASDSAERAMALSVGIVRDAVHGNWQEKRAVADGQSLMLEHAYIESSVLTDHERTPLHLMLGAKETPRVFRN